jgi:hypothetical protein
VIVLIDARRVKGINFGQLAAYVAMVGLAEIRVDAKIGDSRQSCVSSATAHMPRRSA